MTQREVLLNALSDGQPHSTFELIERVYGYGRRAGRLAARVNDLRKQGHRIESWRDEENETMWWYQLIKPEQTSLFPLSNTYS